MDLRQTKPFAEYLESQGWKKYQLKDGTNIFAYKIPLMGNIIRVPRSKASIDISELIKSSKKLDAILIKIEPDALSDNQVLQNNLEKFGFKKDKWSIEPTKTLIIELNKSQDQIFNSFKPKWRQNIRFALKNQVVVKESKDIDAFSKIWGQNAKKKGFLVESPKQTKVLWEQYNKLKKCTLLNTYVEKELVASAFLIIHENECHLWHLGYSGKFENLKPLYLLVWECIKLAKSKKLLYFDFEGIEDPRYPYTLKTQANSFFKMGFSPSEKLFMESYVGYKNGFVKLAVEIILSINPNILRWVYRKANLFFEIR
jgi:lipid II:glycine glycyltransferase (peptidoglycan interpeptide bridge formation enzyme)